MTKKIIYLIIGLLMVIGSIFFFNRNAPSSVYQVVSGTEARALLAEHDTMVIIDVRTLQEYNEGHIPSSHLIPYDIIHLEIESIVPDKSTPILLYCRSGRRSKIAANTLERLGYEIIYDLGAFSDW